MLLYKVREGVKPGIKAYFYTWHGEKPPDTPEGLQAIREEVHSWINFVWWDNPAPGVPGEFFAVLWKGFLYIPETGVYRLYVTTDDGSRVWLDDELVIDAWMDQPPRTFFSKPLHLERGYHRLRYFFYNRYTFSEAILGWIPPEGVGEAGVIPKEYYRYTDSEEVLFTGLPDEYGVEILDPVSGVSKKCFSVGNRCSVSLPYEEQPFYGRLRVLRRTGELLHETRENMEFWGGDEIRVMIGIVKNE